MTAFICFLLLAALAVGVSLLVHLNIHRNRAQQTSVPLRVRSTQSAQRSAAGGSQHTSSGGKTLHYRTKDGRADYKFSYERQSDSTWRAYILSQPPYGSRDEGAHATHRLSDGSRKYVCWSAPIPSFEQAKQVSALWADATQEYIRTGKRF